MDVDRTPLTPVQKEMWEQYKREAGFDKLEAEINERKNKNEYGNKKRITSLSVSKYRVLNIY